MIEEGVLSGAKEFPLAEEEPFYISKGDFDELLALTLYEAHGKKIEIDFPSPLNNQCYVLRSKGYIGQIPLTDKILFRIHPKVPVRNVFRMLEYAYNLKSFVLLDKTATVETLNDLFEYLVSILAKRVLDRARKGLYHNYVHKEEQLAFLRGRIIIMPSLRSSINSFSQLVCGYEEHTADLDDNRILAWTLYQLLRVNLRRDNVRRQVREAYRLLSDVVEVSPIAPCDCINRSYHRLNEDYQPMHILCRFFLEHCGPNINAGGCNSIPFLLHMPSLFESFVAEWLKVNMPSGMYLTKQFHAKLDLSGSLEFIIDLIIRDTSSDRVIAVLDTKYKRNQLPEEGDVQQIIAYAVRMKTRNAFLVYPSIETKSISLKADEINVRTLALDIGIDPDEGGRLFLNKFMELLV